MTNGGLDQKLGLGTLTFLGTTGTLNAGNFEIRVGDVLFDGANILRNGGIRLMCTQTSSISHLVVTNGATVELSGSGLNVRVGSTTPNSDPTSTNVVEVAGTLGWATNSAAFGVVQMGSSCARAIVNLRPGGLLRPGSVSHLGNVTEFNFLGGTLQAPANSATFMQGLSFANVYSPGATIDTAGHDITIPQPLLNGGDGGGLTKIGNGTLLLNGSNTYTGTTVVSAGTLGGTGVISGPVTVGTLATLSPGTSLGRLDILSTLTMDSGSFTVMEIDKYLGITPVADLVAGLTSVTYCGTLVVTNPSNATLALNDTFTLFSATSYHGGFSAYVLPALDADKRWDVSGLTNNNGTIKVVSAVVAQPVISSFAISDGNLIMTGTNGTPGGSYSLLSSTNVAAPLGTWTTNTTGVFDGTGAFSNAVPVNLGMPQEFYLLRVP